MKLISPTDEITTAALIMLIVGEPGIGKTTLANTAEKAVLLDFDGGAVRTGYRMATVGVPENYDDLLKFARGIGNQFKTVVIDTAGALVEKIIFDHVRRNFPNYYDLQGGMPNQKGWGVVKNCFREFERALALAGVDLVYIAHEKTVEAKRGGVSKSEPLIVGSASQIIAQAAHQIGFMFAEGNKRVLSFQTDQTFTSKDSAGIGRVYIEPMDKAPNQFPELISRIKTNILANANRNAKADEELIELRSLISSGVADPDAADMLLDRVLAYEGAAKNALKTELLVAAGKGGLTFNKELKKWERAQDATA